MPSTASSAERRPTRPAAMPPTRPAPSPRRARRAACRSSSAAPGSTSRPCWRACRRCRPSTPRCAPSGAAQAARRPAPELHALLAQRDPEMAARLMPTDPQRIVRALEVLESTGRSLADWQRQPGTPVLAEAETVRLLALPDRDAQAARHRRALRRHAGGRARWRRCGRCWRSASPASCPSCARSAWRRWPPTWPGGLARGGCGGAKTETRQYAKRQLTWLRRNMISWKSHLIRNKWKDSADRLVIQ